MLRLTIVWLFLVLPFSGALGQTFVVGVVPQFEARKIYDIWLPILNELSRQTGHQFELSGSPNISAFEKRLLAGEFDFAYANPYHLLMANQQQGYLPLVRDIGRTLQGILVVAKDSPITDPAQLDGQVVAFPAPNALGASLMIQAELLDRFGSHIIPRFVRTHSSVYFNVILDEVAAGGGVQNTLRKQTVQVQEALRVLYRTQSVPTHPFISHPNVPLPIQQLIRQQLLALGDSEMGKALLVEVPIRQVGKAELEEYLPLSKMGLERFYQGSD